MPRDYIVRMIVSVHTRLPPTTFVYLVRQDVVVDYFGNFLLEWVPNVTSCLYRCILLV